MQKLIQTQKLLQKLSPQQLLVVKMLEDNSLEINEKINKEVEENPALETDSNKSSEDSSVDDTDNVDYDEEDDIPDYKLKGNNGVPKEFHRAKAEENNSLDSYLMSQANVLDIPEDRRSALEYIIGNIESDGYLRRDAFSLSNDIAIQYGLEFSVEEIKELVSLIQTFDPSGVGATNLQECLLLQIRRMSHTPQVIIAEKVMSLCFEDFSRKNYDQILLTLNIKREELKDAIDIIVKLNPRPGSEYNSLSIDSSSLSIIPDFILKEENGNLSVSLNNSFIPSMYVSSEYRDMVKTYSDKKSNSKIQEAVKFAKDKVDSANRFIEAVNQRNKTLLSTIKAIVEFQKKYFLSGNIEDIRPMVLKNIAEITGYDISTISRVSNSKYVETDFGIFSLKDFFSESIMTKDGKEVSSLEIKNRLKQYVSREDKSSPLTDETLSKMFNKKGFIIARRTIAKYREQLGIPVARLRRTL